MLFKKTKQKNKKPGEANLEKDDEVFLNVSSGQEVFLTVTF